VTVTTEFNCPECHSRRDDPAVVCPACGAPPESEKRGVTEEVRSHDLEPYVTLRYIAYLFKILAVIVAILLIAELILGFSEEESSIATLFAEATQLLIFAGLLWAGGDITLLLIDAGHDLRVARILLGRINAELHRKGTEATGSRQSTDSTSPSAP